MNDLFYYEHLDSNIIFGTLREAYFLGMFSA